MYRSIYCYPWDIMDETPAQFCRNVKEQCGVDTVSMAVSYHAAKLILPQNPRRKVYYPDDGSLYFQPDPAAFVGSPIQPHVGALTREQDVLAALCAAAAQAQLDVIAWTVCLHNTRLGEAYPEYAPRNAFGDHVITYLCPAQPAVRHYLCALVADLARRYPVRAIQLEAAHHMPFVHGFHHEMQQVRVTPALQILLGICFCPACLALAASSGIDGARVQHYVAAEVTALLEAGGGADEEEAWYLPYWAGQLQGELGAYLALRSVSVAQMLAEVRQAARAVGTVPIHLQEASAVGAPLLTPVLDLAWQHGMQVPPRADLVDGVTVLGYFSGTERFIAELDAYREQIPPEMPLEIGLRPALPDCLSAEELLAKVRYCRTLGASGVSFYNYGMLPAANRTWIRQALATVTASTGSGPSHAV